MTVPQTNRPETAVTWRKASHSQDEGACVELAWAGAVRDSKNPDGPVLTVTLGALIATLKADRVTR